MKLNTIVCWIFTLSSLVSKVGFVVSILKRSTLHLSKSNNVCKSINFHLNDKWLFCAYCVAGALLHGSTVMNPHRPNSGFMSNQMLIQWVANGSWPIVGEFNLLWEGRESIPWEEIHWSYQGRVSPTLSTSESPGGMAKSQNAEPLSQFLMDRTGLDLRICRTLTFLCDLCCLHCSSRKHTSGTNAHSEQSKTWAKELWEEESRLPWALPTPD